MIIFGFSHLVTLLGLKDRMTLVLIGVRALAYLTVLYSLFRSVQGSCRE